MTATAASSARYFILACRAPTEPERRGAGRDRPLFLSPFHWGVETVTAEHARLFAEAAHEVTIICRRGASQDSRVRVETLEAESSTADEQWLLDEPCRTRLRAILHAQDLVVIHNVMTMPFGWHVAEELARA